MRIVGATALIALAVLLGGARQPPVVGYVLSPVFEGEALTAVAVEVRFTGEQDGETRVRLPDAWAGEKELWKHVSAITADGGTVETQSPGVLSIKHRPHARIVLRYRVTSGYDGDPPAGNPYRPIIRSTWFHLLGEATFAEPEDQEQRRATFAWKDWPKAWTLASDLDHGRMGRPLHVGDVIESVSVGGPDLKVVTRPISGGVARIAVLGTWSFQPEQYADSVAAILDAQRVFWGDAKDPFFVSLIPTRGMAGGLSIGGTGRADGFATFATGNADLKALRYLIGHEHIHSWIPRRVGRMPKPGAQDYWFSEGFTEFYTYRTLLRAGVWSLEDFAESANESLTAYDVSPVRTEPNSRVVKDFWNDEAVGKLPYQRGMLLAFLWDDKVRRATNGAKNLDDVLFLMRDRMTAARTAEEAAFVRPGFIQAMKDVAGLDIAPDIERYVEKGEPIVLPGGLFGDCATLTVEQRRVFERGWDPEATAQANGVVAGLKPDSPAHAAGLRDGMKIVRRAAGTVGDARVEYALVVLDQGVEKTFRFKPEGKAAYTAREIVVAPGLDAAARKACSVSLGGGAS